MPQLSITLSDQEALETFRVDVLRLLARSDLSHVQKTTEFHSVAERLKIHKVDRDRIIQECVEEATNQDIAASNSRNANDPVPLQSSTPINSVPQAPDSKQDSTSDTPLDAPRILTGLPPAKLQRQGGQSTAIQNLSGVPDESSFEHIFWLFDQFPPAFFFLAQDPERLALPHATGRINLRSQMQGADGSYLTFHYKDGILSYRARLVGPGSNLMREKSSVPDPDRRFLKYLANRQEEQQRRRSGGLCEHCGNPLGFFDKMKRRVRHTNC